MTDRRRATRPLSVALLSAAALTAVLTSAAPAHAAGPVSATPPAPFTAAVSSGLSAQAAGSPRVSGGVAHYASLSSVRIDFRITPSRPGQMTVTLQHQSGRTWKTDLTKTMATRTDGTMSVGLTRGNRNVPYRFVGKVAADGTAGESPSVVSPSFVVDGG